MKESSGAWQHPADYGRHAPVQYKSNGLMQQLELMPKALQYQSFEYFCCLNPFQRRNYIIDVLQKLEIQHRILYIDGASHILIQPQQKIQANYSKNTHKYDKKIFVAHYDKRDNTPGANDNSASVWHLLNLAFQLGRRALSMDTPLEILLTDHEELRPRDKVAQQGAYLLGKYLRHKMPGQRIVFFVFDQCGIGERLCYLPNKLSTSPLQLEQDQVQHSICQEHFKYLPVSWALQNQYFFSDNMGLNLWGYPALLYATLPQEEFDSWQKDGVRPAAWSSTHTKNDTVESLDKQSFILMSQALVQLAQF